MDSSLCPAFPAVEGALIIGVNEQGTTSFLPRTITIDKDFVSMTREEPLSEKFRFAGNCARYSCLHFRKGSCHLIQQELLAKSPPVKASELPKCAIRKNCKWYAEKGFYACNVCSRLAQVRMEPVEESYQIFYYHRLA